MNQLIKVTQNAADQIRKILSDAPEDKDVLLVGVDKSGCSGYSYKLDFANSDEIKNYESINDHGVKIFIEPKASMFLVGTIMDYRTDKLSSRFVFDNPNEKVTCGCGESFGI